MTKDDIQLLFAYDRWANHRVLLAVSSLTPEQFTRDLGGSLPSVRDVIEHIIGGQWIWLAYWKATTNDEASSADLRKQRDVEFNASVLPTAAALRLKCKQVEKEMAEVQNALTDQGLARIFPVRNTQLTLAHLMQHVANHSTYHRGQLALMLRQLGAEPVASDFHLFLTEGRGDALSLEV